MRTRCVLALAAGLACIAVLAADASAMYHPTVGRFIQRDPIGYADSVNPYQYVRGASVGATDPWGMQGAPSRGPCCATIAGTRIRLHATVEAKSEGRLRYIYAHPDDSDVGDSRVYSHASDIAYVGLTEGRPDSTNACVWSATIYGSTGPAGDWAGWMFQLSAEARYNIVVTNISCESGRLRVTCLGTASDLASYWCFADATYVVPKGEARSLEGKPWVGLAWTEPAEKFHKGTAWIVLTVSCEEP